MTADLLLSLGVYRMKTWHLHTNFAREFTVKADSEAHALAEFDRLYDVELVAGERPNEIWIATGELGEGV